MDQQVAESRLLDRIFETSPTGIVVLTPQGQITRCNGRAEQLLELEESEIEGKSYTEPEWVFVDDDGVPVDEEDHPFMVVSEGGGPMFSQDFRMERPHAPPMDLSISAAPIRDDDGAVERFVFSFEDVSELRARERELSVITDQLEVLNRVLRHDIRNDLAVMLGWLEVVADEIESEDGQKAIDRVTRAGSHIVDLTDTARDLVNLVMGEESTTPEPIDIGPIVRHEVAVVRESYPEASIEISGNLPESQVHATELLGSVLRNLLTNAIQHNDADAPEVEVRVSESDSRVRLAVADNGPGVPEKQKWDIFGKGTKGLESPSTGIGLYLVESIVTQFGGDVWVEDNDPRGAVFVIELHVAD